MRLLKAAVVLFLLGAIAPAFAAVEDVPGSHDYPGVGRFKGSTITGYDVKSFDAAKMQAAPFKDGEPADPLRIEGKITRIAYRTGPGASVLEVSHNFETQLKSAGYKVLLTCDVDACGGIPFSEEVDVMPIPKMWVDGFNYRYVLAKKADKSDDTYASVLVSQNNAEVTAQLTVAVKGAMENKMIDAAAMAKGLGDKGHIALYGLYFDTNKTVVKPKSKPTLDQIAKLLTDQPKLKVIIVGHTDNQGTLDYNMNLSRKRAEAVADALVKTYKIDPSRLQTAGVAFLAPVASNAAENGRALNRRVELVSP